MGWWWRFSTVWGGKRGDCGLRIADFGAWPEVRGREAARWRSVPARLHVRGLSPAPSTVEHARAACSRCQTGLSIPDRRGARPPCSTGDYENSGRGSANRFDRATKKAGSRRRVRSTARMVSGDNATFCRVRRLVLQVASGFELQDGDQVGSVNNRLVLSILGGRDRTVVRLLGKLIDLRLQFCTCPEVGKHTGDLRRERVGNRFQKAIEVVCSRHTRDCTKQSNDVLRAYTNSASGAPLSTIERGRPLVSIYCTPRSTPSTCSSVAI